MCSSDLGTPVDHVEVGDGLVTLDIGGARLHRRHHNTVRIQGALTEATEGIPFEWPWPPVGPDATVTPIEERGTSDFGDAPPVALLDDEVLRVGACYFWLGRDTDRSVFGCGYLWDLYRQYFRQRIKGMYFDYWQGTAWAENNRLSRIAGDKADSIEVRVHVPHPNPGSPAGVLVPIGGPIKTDADRDALAEQMVGGLRSLFAMIPRKSGAGRVLYR